MTIIFQGDEEKRVCLSMSLPFLCALTYCWLKDLLNHQRQQVNRDPSNEFCRPKDTFYHQKWMVLVKKI